MIWKILKWLLIAAALLIAIVLLVFYGISKMPAVPGSYTRTVETGSALEAEYLSMGIHAVKKDTRKTDTLSERFWLYYPEDAARSEKPLPAVVMLNGTGILPEKYTAWFKHLASWNFIVIGDDNPDAGTGNSAVWMLEELETLNADPSSPLYQKVDFEHVGVIGHSQGGAGALAAVSTGSKAGRFATAIALSPTQKELAEQLGWHYDLTEIGVPVLMLAGMEGGFELETVIPESVMNWMFDQIHVEKVMARKNGADHGGMLYKADGVVTAWLCWQLQGDLQAAGLFEGDTPELKSSDLYQDVRIDLEN